MAVFCENYSTEPAIGKCIQIDNDTIEILWMEGSYTSPWKPWKVRDPKNRRKTIDWTDSIPKLSIVLFGFILTSNNHLRKKTIDCLKQEYSKIRLNNSTPLTPEL